MGERTRHIWTKEWSSRVALDLHYPQVLRIHHRALVHRRETVTGRKQEAVCFGDRAMWLWLLCTTTLPAQPATCPQQIVTHMSVVSFVILGQRKEWERHKFPLDCTLGPAPAASSSPGDSPASSARGQSSPGRWRRTWAPRRQPCGAAAGSRCGTCPDSPRQWCQAPWPQAPASLGLSCYIGF